MPPYWNIHWRQTGLKCGGAEWEFETYLVKFETYSVIRDYETKKTAGAAEPPEPPSLAPMYIIKITTNVQRASMTVGFSKTFVWNHSYK